MYFPEKNWWYHVKAKSFPICWFFFFFIIISNCLRLCKILIFVGLVKRYSHGHQASYTSKNYWSFSYSGLLLNSVFFNADILTIYSRVLISFISAFIWSNMDNCIADIVVVSKFKSRYSNFTGWSINSYRTDKIWYTTP